MMSEGVFVAPKKNTFRFVPETGKMVWMEKNCLRVFAPGEARCWIKGEKQPNWRGHWMPRMANPCHSPASRYDTLREKHEYPRSSMRVRTRKQWAAHEWLKTFPDDYCRELSMVSDHFFWGTLSLLTRIPEGREIFLQNPAWAILAVYGWRSPWAVRIPSHFWETVRVAFRHRKREVLGKFGMPESESCVKMLRKVHVRHLTWLQLNEFMTLWRTQSPYLRILQHMEHIEPTLIQLLAALENEDAGKGSSRLSTELLLSLKSRQAQRFALDLLRDVTMMEGHLSREPGLEMLPYSLAREIERGKRFSSMAALEDWHDELSYQVNERITARQLAALIPDPPIPGDRIETQSGWVEIRRFRTGGDLIKHAREQKHCMAYMLEGAVKGTCFLYEVISDFAPLHSLQIHESDSGWRITQLYGYRNRGPHREVVMAVEDWLGLKEERLQRERKLQIVQDIFGGEVFEESYEVEYNELLAF